MKKENQDKLIKYLRRLIVRWLVVIIIFLLLAIFNKKDEKYRDWIVANIYEKQLSFVKIKNFYNKYFGGVIPLEHVIDNVSPVFNEELEYDSQSIYYDGVMLEVSNNYLVPVIEEGMVVYVGEKEKYGNVVIVEGVDGVMIWYGNMNRVAVKLYDYVSRGGYLGDTIDDKLYLVYSKDNNFLDYKEYLE